MTSTTTAFVMTHSAGSHPSIASTSKTTSIISLALTRALGRAGVRVVRVHPDRMDHSLASRYCSATEVCPDLYRCEETLVAFLKQMAERYPGKRVLFPASDDCAAFLGAHQNRLGTLYEIVIPPVPAMERLRCKRAQYELALEAGIPVPETYFPATRCEAVGLSRSLSHYPYVIKPLVAQRWRHARFRGMSRSRKAFVVRSPEELLREYDRIAAVDAEVMVQEVIGGGDERLYTLLACCGEGGRPIAMCVRRKLRQSPIDFGYCTLTESCHDETVRRQGERLLSHLGYRGIVGIEFKQDPNTGDYRLIEINPRAVNTLGLACAAGANIPLAAFRDQLGEPAPTDCGWRDGIRWIWLDQDFWAARQLVAEGRLTTGAWMRSLLRVRTFAIFAADDPRPSLEYFSQECASYLRSARGRFVSGALRRATG